MRQRAGRRARRDPRDEGPRQGVLLRDEHELPRGRARRRGDRARRRSLHRERLRARTRGAHARPRARKRAAPRSARRSVRLIPRIRRMRMSIANVAKELGIEEEHVETYGRDKAKIDLAAVNRAPRGASRLVLLSAINPTPAGEGKTTTAVGPAMGLRRRGKNVALCLRRKVDGVPRQERFDITAASEIMAIVALASGYEDLEARLARVVIGSSSSGAAITAGDVGAAGAMTALLRDALKPNLVQTAEGGPAIVHAGPFGNIAHGCNSILATRLAMSLGDYAITEGGFGFDLGGEKFLNIKCRIAGIWPRAVVIVATLRALKMHGGAPVKSAGEPDAERLAKGLAHLEKHLENAAVYGLPPVVAINGFPNDTDAELELVREAAAEVRAQVERCEGFANGGEGAFDLPKTVCE